MFLLYILIGLLVFFLILFLRFKMPAIKGAVGEFACSAILHTLPAEEYLIVDNLLLDTPYGTTQIDHVVLSIYGIFVIETKNYSGWIFGREDSENWTQNIYGHKNSFRNPIKQNKAHINAIKSLLNLSTTENLRGIVVFSNRATLKTHTISMVINAYSLRRCIKQFHQPIFDMSLLKEYENQLSTRHHYTKEEKKEHIHQVRQKEYLHQARESAGLCPRCGGELVLRQGKYGSFYGCKNYPKCRYTKKI